MKIILLLLTLFMVSCTMYEGLSMKPHKTSVTTTYGQDEVDKANDSKGIQNAFDFILLL